MKINDVLVEFASTGGGNGGNYLKALASAWYNGTFNTGDLHKGIKSQEDVERILERGIHCGDGKIRKYSIGYNANFDGVEIQSDDHYEYADYDDAGNDIDSRNGKPWGPYDVVEFHDRELDESIAEARASSAAFRSSNTRRGELNAMTPEERKAHDDKRAEQQRKRDDARLARERAKNVAEATMTPDQIAAARAAAPYGYNPQTGKPNPAPAGTAPSAAKTAQAFNTLAAQSPQQGADRQARLDAWKASQGIAVPARTPAAQPAAAPAVDQAAIDRQAAKFGLPPGSTKEELVAAIQSKSFSKPPAAPAAPAQAPAAQAQPAKPAPAKGAVGQAAIAADAAGQNADAAALAAMQKKNPKLAAMMAQAGMNADGTDIAEAKKKEKEADYGDDYQDMVSRVKKLAGLGPLKTVYDPAKRVYKNVPTAVQPKK